MNRSGAQNWKGLLALALLILLGGLPVAPTAAQTNGTEPDKQEVALHYSLYYENYKNNNFRDALQDLHWILNHAPGFPRNKDTNFERAVKAYEALAEQAEDTAEKRRYLDSVLVMFDRAVPTIKAIEGSEIDEFEWTRNKGRFIQTNVQHLDDRKGEAIEAYVKAYQLDSKRLDPFYLDIIIRDHYTRGDIGAALDFLRELNEIRGDEEPIQDLIRKFFAVIPPEEQIEFLEEQFADNPDDPEVAKQLFELYEQEGYKDKMMEMAPTLMQMDPTPQVLRLLTRLYIENGDYDKAEGTFAKLEGMPNAEVKPEDYLNMGISQQGKNNYTSARNYYRKALDLDPNFKRAEKAIADLYATAVSACGVSDRKGKAVFWLVSDAYARAGDSAGASRYRSVFPSEEDVFFFNEWTKGATVSVTYTCRGLTISGSTTVRTSN